MKKRTIASLLFYFFFITNAKHANGQKNSTELGDFVFDMVKAFALSGEDAPLGGKKWSASKMPHNNSAIAAMLSKFLGDHQNGDEVPNGGWDDKCRLVFSLMKIAVPSATKLSESCADSFTHLICDPLKGAHTKEDALKNLLLHSPLGKILDSWNKLPTRVLLGNFEWVGAYDECSSVQEAKYCLSDIDLSSAGLNQTLHYGSCWPEQCTTDDVVLMMTVLPLDIFKGIEDNMSLIYWSVTKEVYAMLKKMVDKVFPKIKPVFSKIKDMHVRTLCDNEVDYYTAGWQAILTICAMFALACIIGTTIETIVEMRKPDAEEEERANAASNAYTIDEKPGQFQMECGVNNIGFTSQYSTTTLTKSQSESKLDTTRTIESTDDADSTFRSPVTYKNSKDIQGSSCNYLLDFFLCFSIIRNSRTIFCTKVPSKTVKCINGMRVITFTWVIVANYYAWVLQKLGTDNLKTVFYDKVYDFSFLVVSNCFVSVDTFFLLSGFLTGYLSLRKYNAEGFKIGNVLYGYLHRYIRITPCLGLIFLMYFFLPQILRGPRSLIITQTDEMSGGVKDYWWAAILYINNFYPTMKASGSISWSFYLSNDMQFFVMAPAFLYVVYRIDRTYNKTAAVLYNFLFLFSICLASFITTAMITLIGDLPAIGTAALIQQDVNPYKDPFKTFEDFANKIYLKPYCRITPYIVGLFLGYLLVKDIRPATKGMGKLITSTGWISAVIGGLTVVFGPWRVFSENAQFFSPVERGLYAACHSFVWASAVAWVIYACHYKRGGIVNTILSWPVWTPLARLTFAAYLLHFEVIYTYTFLQETAIHYQTTVFVCALIAVIVLTYAGAYVLAVCVEYPIMNVERYVRRVFFRR